jgi:hypothetical protein
VIKKVDGWELQASESKIIAVFAAASTPFQLVRRLCQAPNQQLALK